MTLAVHLLSNDGATDFWFESYILKGECTQPEVYLNYGYFPDCTPIEEAVETLRAKALEYKRYIVACYQNDIPLIEKAEYRV